MNREEKITWIMGEMFLGQIESLSISEHQHIETIIDEMVSSLDSVEKVEAKINEFVISRLKAKVVRATADDNRIVYAGIERLTTNCEWSNLRSIAEHAMKGSIIAIENGQIDGIAQSMAEGNRLKLAFIGTGVSGYAKIIKQMKQHIVDYGIVHWLTMMKDKPDSEHVTYWKDSAKKLITDLLDMDKYVELPIGTGKDKLTMYEEVGNYAVLGFVRHWSVAYLEHTINEQSDDHDDAYYINASLYFHSNNKDQAIELLINRYLHGDTEETLKDCGCQSLEEIKAAGFIR